MVHFSARRELPAQPPAIDALADLHLLKGSPQHMSIGLMIRPSKRNGYSLKFAAPKLFANRDLMLETVKSNGDSLQYAAPELKTNDEYKPTVSALDVSLAFSDALSLPPAHFQKPPPASDLNL